MAINKLKGNRYYIKFQNMSPMAKTSLALVIAKFIQKGLSFITGPIFTRIMSSSQYGIISTFSSWQSILYIIGTLNMSSGGFNNGLLEFKEDRNTFTFSILILANICTMVCALIIFVFYERIAGLFNLPSILLIFLFFYCLTTPAYNYWLARSRFEYKYRSVFIVSILLSIFSTLNAIILVLISPSENKGVAKVIGTESAFIIAGLIFYFYTVYHARAKIKFRYWKYELSISLPLVPHYLSLHVLSSSDRIMITNLVNTSKTAIYSVCYSVASIVLVFWNAIDAAYAPWIYQKMEEKDYEALRYRAKQLVLLFGGCSILVTLFAPEIIRLLGPKEYYEGVYIIPAVVAGVFFTAIFSLYIRIELFLKKTSTIMVATVISALINIILNYLFINLYGYWAAGYTTMFCYMLLAVFHALNLRRWGYGNVYDNKFIVMISTVLCVLIFCASALYTKTMIRYFIIFVFLIVALYKKKIILDLVKGRR